MEPLPVPSGGDINKGFMLLVPTTITTIVGVILTILRLYVRFSIVKIADWSDFWHVLGLVFLIIAIGMTCGFISNGFGRHLYYLSHAQAALSLKLSRVVEFMVIFSTICIKLSVCLFLMRLLVTNKKWRFFLWAFMTFNTITSLADAALIFPECSPVARSWDFSILGTCWSPKIINIAGYVQGSIAFTTDIVLSILPIVFLWNIRIKLKIKMGICGLMALGICSGICALSRTVLVINLKTADPTWDGVSLFTLGILEASIGLIAAALPTIRPLFGRTTQFNTLRQNSRSLPLHHINSGCTTRRLHMMNQNTSTLLAAHSSTEQILQEKAATVRGSRQDTGAGEGSSKAELRDQGSRRILKTTDIDITREVTEANPHSGPILFPRNS